MKITKKIIMILSLMIIAILTLGMAKVNAADLPISGNTITGRSLNFNTTYHITYPNYRNLNNLFCVEKGQKLSSQGTDYKLIKHIKIKDSTSWSVNRNTGNLSLKQRKSTANEKISKDYNKKLATAIATLDNSGAKESNDLQYFLWGYFNTWNRNVGSVFHGVPVNFSTKQQAGNYAEIDGEIEEKLEDINSSVDDLTDETDYNKITFQTIQINKKDFVKIGPFKISGIPSNGLKTFKVKQNDRTISGVEIYRNGNIIDASNIRNNKEFYICIPRSENVTNFSASITTNKIKTTSVTAHIYLLQCIGTNAENWQNLIVTTGNSTTNNSDVTIRTQGIKMPGDLTIIKKDSTNQEPLEGAQFVIFRYVQAKGGSWYRKGDTYTQTQGDATDKNTQYKREYVNKKDFSYDKIGYLTASKNNKYIYTTDKDGKVNLTSLEPGTYFAIEVKAPEGYKKIDKFFKLGQVKSAEKIEPNVGNEPSTTDLEITKVNEDNQAVVITGVGFKFRHETDGWLKEISKGKYEYKQNESDATLFKTDDKGKINLLGIKTGKWTYQEDETTLPPGYVIGNKGETTFTLESKDKNTKTITNKQKYIKLSGYVWLDEIDGKNSERNNLYKTSTEELPDSEDLLFNGITVKLKNKKGETVKETKTSKLDRYKDSMNNGNGEYLFEEVDTDELSNYYIEFKYDGLTYTNVVPQIDKNTGSKAAESVKSRNEFNEKFSIVEGKGNSEGYTRGADGKTESGVSLSYNINQEQHEATLDSDGKYKIEKEYIEQTNIGAYPITATTDEAKYNIKDHFTYGEEEVRYINLGLYERAQPDISLGKELKNVKVTVNGHEHTYDYAERYASTNTEYKEGDFNVGVKFKNGTTGTYTRAMYKSDYEYNPEDKEDKELKVYITYELKMLQTNKTLNAKINSIVDYYDSRYTLESVGTKLNKNDIEVIHDTDYNKNNNKYNKVIISCNTELNPQTINSIYVQFKLSKDQVAEILKDKEVGDVIEEDKLLNNVAEINSYSIFDKDGKPYAGIDEDSNPGNCEPGNINTYEDDTDSSPALQLEVADAREMTGKVFEDDVVAEQGQNAEQVMTGKERLGSGAYEEGEKGIGEVDITLREANSGTIYKTKTVSEDGWYRIEKDEDNDKDKEYTMKVTQLEHDDGATNTHELKKGDYYIIGYLPGDYILTYTWGDQKYTVQDYKGTIYQEKERKNSNKWWYVDGKYNNVGEEQNTDNVIRYSDAIDDYQTRGKIDEQIKTIDKDTKTDITKMTSSTPTEMKIDVEYKTAYSSSNGRKYSYCIDNIDFGIVERAKQILVLNNRIKTMKVTLANGQEIVNLEIDEHGNMSGKSNGVTHMKPDPNTSPPNGFIRLEMDNELIQGTKLEIGYEIKASNNSELDYATEEYYKYGTNKTNVVTILPTGVINYLDKNWAFDQQQNTQWETKTIGEIKNLVAEEVYNTENQNSTVGEKTILYTKGLTKDPEGLTKYLEPTESNKIMLNVSKILTTTDEISLDTEAEEVQVTKTGGATLETTPGNYIPGQGAQEADDSMAETTIVTPATGENLNYMIPIVIGTTALIILGAGVIIIKKKVI